jgi:hypothetical protein
MPWHLRARIAPEAHRETAQGIVFLCLLSTPMPTRRHDKK